MMLLGLVWAVLAPLLLVLPGLLLWHLFRRLGQRRPAMMAAATVIGVVGAVHLWDRAAFSALCRDAGRATILRTAQADGIFLDSGTANSFGNRYVQQEGFAWIERRDIYNRGGYVRISRGADGRLEESRIPAPTAAYEVRETHESPDDSTHLSWTQVVERQSGEVIAQAARGHFLGGRMRWVLGAYGSASCPSAFSDPAAFQAYYHLARDTLRPPVRQP